MELTQRYTANASTSAIWDHLITLVEKRGSLAGMLQAVAGPLLHQYATPAFQAGPDLLWLRMSPAGATAYSNAILANISATNTTLFGASPAPSKLYLFQNTVDVLCCDVDAMKQSLAAPELRVQASVGAAAHAVLSALQSAAAVAAANARGDEAAASRAAQAAAAAAQSAIQHAQQLQVLGVNAATTTRLSASIPLQAQQAAETPVIIEDSAAEVEAVPVAELTAVGGTGGLGSSTDMGTAACASLQQAAAAADIAAEMAQGPQPYVLPRGAGMLMLLPDSWGGKAVQLRAGRALVGEQRFTHYSIVQLMSAAGVLLQQGSAQTVQVRVAAEFLTAGPAPQQQQQQLLTGHWSKKAYKLSVTPGANLLLHCSPTHTWGKKFTASCPAACSSYEALYTGLSLAKVTSALGEQGV